jgi:hypothetical protein
LIKTICCLAGEPTLIEDSRAEFAYSGMLDAIQQHNDYRIFNWIIEAVSYQGIADAVAATYIEEHGIVSATDIEHELSTSPPCPKLKSYWHYAQCGYRKSTRTCNEQKHLAG